MDEYAVEYDEEAGEYVASTPTEDYCTPSAHLAYIWLAAQLMDTED
jgi:hypothetical protein